MTNTVYIQITDGKVENRTTLAKAIQALPTGRYEFKISRKNKRSLPQNSYFHGPLLDQVLIGLRDAGWNNFKYPAQVKSFLKTKFLKVQEVNEETGEVLEYIRDTHDLNKTEFNLFIDEIAQFCSEYLGFVLLMPGEQVGIFTN